MSTLHLSVQTHAIATSVDVRGLKAELERVAAEHDFPKKAATYFSKGEGEVRIHGRPSLGRFFEQVHTYPFASTRRQCAS